MTTKTIYWTGRENDGTPPALEFKPAIQWPPIESIPALLEKWGDVKDGHAIFFNAMDWKEGDVWKQPHSTQILKAEGTEDHVCVESMAEHITSGMGGWSDECGEYWQRVCRTIASAGYSVDVAIGDLETPNMKTHYKYHRENGPPITMPEVIKHIYANGRPEGFPNVDVDVLLDPSPPWGKQIPMQNKYIWDHHMAQMNAAAFERVFAVPVKRTWEGAQTNNYNHCRYDGAPAIVGKHPRPNAPVDGNSAFVAYLNEKAFFQDVPTLKAAMRAISGPPEKVWIWVQGPWHIGKPGVLTTLEKYNEICDFVRECGFNLIIW